MDSGQQRARAGLGSIIVRARVAFWTGVEIKVKFTFKDSSSVESTLNRPPP